MRMAAAGSPVEARGESTRPKVENSAMMMEATLTATEYRPICAAVITAGSTARSSRVFPTSPTI